MTANELARRLAPSSRWLACLVLLHLGVVLVVHSWGDWTDRLPVASCGPMLLLGWWATVSRVRICWKLVGYCLGMTVIFVLFSWSYMAAHNSLLSWTQMNWQSFAVFGNVEATIEAPVTLLLFLVAARLPRRWRARLAPPFGVDSNNHARGVWQFTLADLLLLAAALAATLGLLLWTAPYPAWLLDLPQLWLASLSDVTLVARYCLGSMGGVLLTLTAAWLVLETSRLHRRLLIIIPVLLWPPVAISLTCLIYRTHLDLASLGLDPVALILAGVPKEYGRTLSLFAALTASFVMVRFAGYRLHCGTSAQASRQS
ncbi:MAG: hypothetical protein GY835_22175 [bacterium]|nr:hypothetical protein [bacterium]